MSISEMIEFLVGLEEEFGDIAIGYVDKDRAHCFKGWVIYKDDASLLANEGPMVVIK